MSQLRVLIVEDEILIRRFMVDNLKSLGCIIAGETAYGEEAVRMASEIPADIILMDIRLKGEMDGVAAAREISHFSCVPILFMSAYKYSDFLKHEEIPSMIGYINKPVEQYELEVYLNKLKS
jgi:YesN/AraC family two-component response regulator